MTVRCPSLVRLYLTLPYAIYHDLIMIYNLKNELFAEPKPRGFI